jgi:hypothetical protein
MPTTAQNTFSMANRLDPYYEGNEAPVVNINLGNSLTLAKGTVMGELTATPGTFIAYASGNADGSQIPKGILQYAVTTDGSGNATIANEQGLTQKAVPMYIGGIFNIADLTGLDANAVTKLGGNIVMGIISAGLFQFGF